MGSRSRAPGEESGGTAPLKLKHFWYLNVQWKLQICPIFYNLEPQRNRIFVLYLQKIMGGHETEGPGAKLGDLCPPSWPGLKPPLKMTMFACIHHNCCYKILHNKMLLLN